MPSPQPPTPPTEPVKNINKGERGHSWSLILVPYAFPFNPFISSPLTHFDSYFLSLSPLSSSAFSLPNSLIAHLYSSFRSLPLLLYLSNFSSKDLVSCPILKKSSAKNSTGLWIF